MRTPAKVSSQGSDQQTGDLDETENLAGCIHHASGASEANMPDVATDVPRNDVKDMPVDFDNEEFQKDYSDSDEDFAQLISALRLSRLSNHKQETYLATPVSTGASTSATDFLFPAEAIRSAAPSSWASTRFGFPKVQPPVSMAEAVRRRCGKKPARRSACAQDPTHAGKHHAPLVLKKHAQTAKRNARGDKQGPYDFCKGFLKLTGSAGDGGCGCHPLKRKHGCM